ncbi:recombinase family protein [Sphingomonas chungangi]
MACRREIVRRGWTEIGVFSDDAESAATAHRPGYQSLLRAIENGGVDIVCADAMDRVSRSQADIAVLYERLKFRGIQLWTLKEGVVTPLHVGMMGTINAQQLSATADKTRDALRRRHEMGKNTGGCAYGYEKDIQHDGNGERIKGLLKVVPSQAAIVTRICEEYASGVSPYQIALRLNAQGVPPPRSGKRDKRINGKPPAWTPNTITGSVERGTGILNNELYVGRRPYQKQTYRKNPDTGRRHAFLRTDDDRPETVEVPKLRIISDELWKRVKERQAQLAHGPRPKNEGAGRVPFFAQQRPKYLLTGKMNCGECGASFAKSGTHRFGCQGSAKKGPTYCGNRLTIRQDELDARILAGLTSEMMKDDVLAAFLDEYEAEMRRLDATTASTRPEREVELAEVEGAIATIKTAILKGIDASLFVAELKQLETRRQALATELAEQHADANVGALLHPDLSQTYRKKVARLTDAYEEEALKAQAFERIRALIEQVTLTPEDGVLAVHLRGDLVSMLELCACGDMQNAPEEVSSGALQIKMVAGTGFEPVTFRL